MYACVYFPYSDWMMSHHLLSSRFICGIFFTQKKTTSLLLDLLFGSQFQIGPCIFSFFQLSTLVLIFVSI